MSGLKPTHSEVKELVLNLSFRLHFQMIFVSSWHKIFFQMHLTCPCVFVTDLSYFNVV